VVGVSAPTADTSQTGEICEFCGFEITDEDQRCSALDHGRCQA